MDESSKKNGINGNVNTFSIIENFIIYYSMSVANKKISKLTVII